MDRIQQTISILLRYEVVIVIGVTGLSLVIIFLLPYALAVVASFWILRWIKFGYPSVRTPNDWGVVILVVMSVITILATALPGTTRPQVYRLLLGIGVYYAIANWTDTQLKLRLLIAGLSLSGLLLSIFGLFSVQWNTGKVPFIPDSIYQYIPTLVSDLIHRNVLAGTLVLIIPIPIALLIYSWYEIKQVEKIIFTFSAVSIILILFLTQSRAAWMAFVFSIGIMALMGGKRTRLLLLLGIFIGILVIFFVGITPFLDAIIASNTIGGIDGRIETWSRALSMVQDFPFTGVGMGSFFEVANNLYPFTRLGSGTIDHAHNLFFQIGVDMGIPGLIGWLAILLVILSVSWQLYKEGKRSTNKILLGLGIGLFCSQIALCTHGILDAVIWGMVRSAPIVWVIWGLAVVSGFLILTSNTRLQN